MNSIWNTPDGVQVRYASGKLEFFRTPLDALNSITNNNNRVSKISFKIGQNYYRWIASYDNTNQIHDWSNQPMSFAMNYFLENQEKLKRGEITEQEKEELDENVPYLEVLHNDDFRLKCIEWDRAQS